MKRSFTIHPFLFALHPVLSLFLHNWETLPIREAVGTMALVLASTLLLWLFIDYFVKNRNKSAIIVSVFLVLFFSYDHTLRTFITVFYNTQVVDAAGFLANARLGLFLWLCAWGTLFAVAVYLTIRSSSDMSLATRVLNIMSLVLIITAVASWFYSYDVRAGRYIDSWQEAIQSEEHAGYDDRTPDSLPDIYYIILDGYAGADILQELYQVDNSEFRSYLAQKGFYVVDKSNSNYSQTALSLASSLNYSYCDELADQMGSDSENRLPLGVVIENNKVFQQLRDQGYNIWAFSTGYPLTEIESADVYMSPRWTLNAFQNELINTTPLPILLLRSQYDFHRERMLYTFDHLVDATQIDSPTFVFAHILAPHPPFVFGANGEHVYSLRKFGFADGNHLAGVTIDRREYVESYRDQLAFISARMQLAIEEILSQSSEPPIIIVQADHGPGSMLYWQSVEHSNVSERMSILNAYYFPDQDYDALYQDITPVNTFRVVFNHYLDTDYEMLEDRSYFSTWTRPYAFVDVTDKIR